ncbi:protein usg [Devosia sp. ZB163]|uniref:protein usg n=1 Tax=Devosia sp. ZB163 TaxID=3025938 RepID=UPI002361B0BD|nr:protein usg [Devosia sp. ZB163]MDC9825101.1 protein usg [Devosia sp. ZB163]
MPSVTRLGSAVHGYGLTTAQIIYHVPDNYALLQDFLWQEYDVFPEFPTLRKFLAFWEDQIEGRLHSITVAHACLIHPIELYPLQSTRLH